MTAKGKHMLCRVAVAIVTTLLAACDGGPSEAEYVAACLKEGEMGANKALRKEVGVKYEAMCKCAAAEVSSSLSADARRSMVLNMQGKKQESKAIISKMSEAEKMASMNAGLDMVKKCGGP
jgi:hypothetical protein